MLLTTKLPSRNRVMKYRAAQAPTPFMASNITSFQFSPPIICTHVPSHHSRTLQGRRPQTNHICFIPNTVRVGHSTSLRPSLPLHMCVPHAPYMVQDQERHSMTLPHTACPCPTQHGPAAHSMALPYTSRPWVDIQHMATWNTTTNAQGSESKFAREAAPSDCSLPANS